MSVKYMKRETAKGCPVHQAVMDTASDELAQHGYFSKVDVLDSLSFGAMEDAIRWDYLREFLEADYGIELIPLSKKFFNGEMVRLPGNSNRTRVHYDPVKDPEKCIAMGNGKKTYGYASVEVAGGALAIKTFERKKGMANGVGEAFKTFAEALVKRNIIDYEGEPKQLE